jgi:hypothetical protein
MNLDFGLDRGSAYNPPSDGISEFPCALGYPPAFGVDTVQRMMNLKLSIGQGGAFLYTTSRDKARKK